MSFNPDDYLKKKRDAEATPTPVNNNNNKPAGFDPDAYLKTKAAASVNPTEISKLESGLRGAAQGATLGFSDELVGAGEGLLRTLKGEGSLSENYTKARDESREANKAAEEANSLTYLGGNLLGGVATSALPVAGAMGLGKAAASVIKGGGVLAKIARGAVGAGATGGVVGAVQGVGSSEGKSAGEILKDGAGGAAVGASLGGAFGGAGKLLPGVKDSVSNDLYRKVLGVTVGDDLAESATKLLKNPDARNRIVAMANKDTVGAARDTIKKSVSADVSTFQTKAADVGKRLLEAADNRLNGKRVEVIQDLDEKLLRMAGSKEQGAVFKVLGEVRDNLDGKGLDLQAAAGVNKTTTTPAADAFREARDSLKLALFSQGNPKMGVKDSLLPSERKVLQEAYDTLQKSYKSVPEAATADLLYTRASNYTKLAQKNLFRPDGSGGKEISNAAVEAFALGKGAPGKTEDLDRLFRRREEFAKVMKDAGIEISEDSSKAALDAAREVMDFNRLGAGDTTGRSAIPAIVGSAFATTVGAPVGGLATALTAAAYNPRMYLRALAKADNLTSEDRKVMAAIVKALKLEGIKQADKRNKKD